MLRILTSRAAQPGTLRAKFTFPDPEHMAQLAQVIGQRGSVSPELSREFSTYVSSIRIVGHISKLTAPDRLRETNRVLCQHLRSLGPERVRLVDIGGSDGVTTLDLVQKLRDEMQVDVQASMLDLYVRLLRFARGGVVEYRMIDGSPIMVRLGRLGLQLSSVGSTRDPISRLLGTFYLGRRKFRAGMHEDGAISLVNPRVVADRDITVSEWNALERKGELVGKATAVRASNILNRSYFSDEQVLQMAGHLHAYLSDRGLLIVSRNRAQGGGETEEGSIWRKEDDRFRHLEDFGGGSEVTELINEFRAIDSPTSV